MIEVLVARELTKVYTDAERDIVVLNKAELNIKQAETIAIIGASGVGKTTLLQLLGGLDAPTRGEVVLMGHSFLGLSTKKKGDLRNKYLGFVYQFHHLMPEFNALENVCIPLLIRGEKLSIIKEKASYYIEQVGLQDRLTHRIGELSGGERQRIAIARALVSEPACVLADEPTGNLDEGTARQVTDLLLTLNQKLKTSFVIVTHNRKLASEMQRTLTITNGHLQDEKLTS